MSLSRCVCVALRSRHSLHRTVLPLVSTVTPSLHQGAAATLASPAFSSQLTQVGGVRGYGSRKSSATKYQSSSSSDSDSDRAPRRKGSGARGKYGQSSFWRRKMRTHHQLLDLNHDGVVSWDDFEVLIAKFRELGHLTPEEVASFSDALRHVWEEEWGASSDPYIFIGSEQFLSQMEHVVNTKDLRKKVAKPLPYFFKAVDRDGSGEISIEEFKMFYACLGLSQEVAAESFAAIDTNGDGLLSIKEFVKLGRDFFLSEDETRPSKLFWGPLAD